MEPLADSRLRELAQLCRPGLKWKWRTMRGDDGWKAELKCGYADGAFPIWSASAATEQGALDQVIGSAVYYWEGTCDRARRLRDWRTGMLDLSSIADEELLTTYLEAEDHERLTELEQVALDEIERRGLDI